MTQILKTKVLIIGAGTGGYVAGIRCGQLGLETVPPLLPLIPAKAGTQSCYRNAGVSGFLSAKNPIRRISQRTGSPLSRG